MESKKSSGDRHCNVHSGYWKEDILASQVYKAQRCTINVGDIPLEVAMLPDSSYRLSYAQATEAVDKNRNSMLRFCGSKYLKGILGAEFECYSFSEEIYIEGVNRPINSVTFELACLYWQKCAVEGNKKAQALIVALVKRSLYELADEAFGTKRLRQERDRMLNDALSEQGIAWIETIRQNLDERLPDAVSDTQAERELKLKIRLAEIELEREKLQHGQDKNCLPARDIERIGVPPWKVIFWTQKTLGWADNVAALRLIRHLGYGVKGDEWFTARVVGDLWLLPWPSFNALTKKVEKLRSESN